MPNFVDLTEEDFAPARPAGTNPATGKQFTFGEMADAVSGPKSRAQEIEPSMLQRILAGAGMGIENKVRGVRGQPAVEDYGLGQDPAGSFGAMVPEAMGSMVAKNTLPAQMAYGAVVRGMEPAPNMLDRGVNALKGAAEYGTGQALASGLVKGANAAAGNLTRQGEVASAAGKQGLTLSAGDILDSKLMRSMEEKSFKSPTAGQADEVAKMFPSAQQNPITYGVQTAYQNAQAKVADAASRLDDIIASNPKMPGVTARNFYESVQEIARRSPDTLKNVRDPVLAAKLEAIANYPKGRIPQKMTFMELDELRKELGPIMSKVEAQSLSGASNVNVADANRWKRLYKSIMEDMDSWGSVNAPKEAREAHRQLSETFKSEVLPLREHPIAGKILDDAYARPEDILRDLTSPRNRSVVNQLYERLDQGGKNALDALRATQRGTKEFVKGEPATWSKPLTLGGAGAIGLGAGLGYGGTLAATLPWLAGGLAGEQALVHGLNTNLGRRILGGSAQAAKSPLANRAIYGGLRGTLPQGALQMLKDEQ